MSVIPSSSRALPNFGPRAFIDQLFIDGGLSTGPKHRVPIAIN